MPVLRRRGEFEAALKDYRMSDQALKTLQATPFVLLVAASGGGRNTIIERLVETGRYYYIVSDTTRPPRVRDGVQIEQDGNPYFFRSEDDVLADLKQGRFIEAALIHDQQVSGISLREIEKAHQSGKLAITDVDVQGSATIEGVKADVISIFVLPPSFEEWLSRIRRRSNLPAVEIKNRLVSAIEEIDTALQDERFVFIINDKMEEALATVDEIARLGKHHRRAEEQAHALAADLRDQASEYLELYPNW